MLRKQSLKRRIIELRRIIKSGLINFVRNATLAVAAMAVMVVTLTIILFSVIANATFSNTIQRTNDKISVSVYLKDSVTDKQRDKFTKDLKAIKNVKSVSYVSKDQALEIYKKLNQSNQDTLVAVSQIDNPLPASLDIKPKDPNQLQEIKNYLEKPQIKALQSDATSYSGDRKEAIDNITRTTKFFRQAGVLGVVVFALVSMLIIFNTIRMAIFNRRAEIQIMRLLGASTNYIRGPFIVETVLYGIISAIISISLCYLLFVVSPNAFEASSLGLLDIKFASKYFSNNFLVILTAQLSIGILIGAVSSIIATRRYLKFKAN